MEVESVRVIAVRFSTDSRARFGPVGDPIGMLRRIGVTRKGRVVVCRGMKLRWIYLGLVVALTITAFVFQRLGSAEVASHAFFHLVFAAGVAALMWFMKRPVSAPNRWLWRGGWAVSAAQWVEALGAFGYDDRATSAVPGLRLFHNLVAPLVFFSAVMILIASILALAWTRLPRPAAIGLVVFGCTATIFMIAVTIGFAP